MSISLILPVCLQCFSSPEKLKIVESFGEDALDLTSCSSPGDAEGCEVVGEDALDLTCCSSP